MKSHHRVFNGNIEFIVGKCFRFSGTSLKSSGHRMVRNKRSN
jgi:hypothetical protein